MTAEPKLPRGVLAEADTAVGAVISVDPGLVRRISRAALEAAYPAIERAVLQRAAARMLELDAADRSATRNVGPYGSLDASVHRLLRGQPLPSVPELRGGSVPQEFR